MSAHVIKDVKEAALLADGMIAWETMEEAAVERLTRRKSKKKMKMKKDPGRAMTSR